MPDTLSSSRVEKFQSTLSSRRATVHFVQIRRGNLDFNPRSPHGERPQTAAENAQDAAISIHALLTESDGLC